MAKSFMQAIKYSTAATEYDVMPFPYREEAEYPQWTTSKRLWNFILSRPENVTWNALLAALALVNFVIMSMEYVSQDKVLGLSPTQVIDLTYNCVYGLHVLAHMFRFDSGGNLKWYAIDLISFAHYTTPHLPDFVEEWYKPFPYVFKMICYHLRLHRPFRFLWGLNDYYLKGSRSGTLLKYWYIFILLHVMCTNLYIWISNIEEPNYVDEPEWLQNNITRYFYRGIYIIYKRIIPIGMDIAPKAGDELDRVIQMFAMLSGALLVTGLTVAALTLAIDLHMRPKEQFRARVRLIISDMKLTHVPYTLLQKVETFYSMYWHKQKGVSVTRLLPTYPPTLESDIKADIYFEALQKCPLLRDTSYQFLSEIAKHMHTVHYIPGDIIIKRKNPKFAMIYISYGDVEMLTAEDDETPILRFTRGSIMNPCAGAIEVASSEAHVCIRAATFCTAHVLKTVDVWRVTSQYGRFNGQSYVWQSAFYEHFEKVQYHYAERPHANVKRKTTIVVLKRNLMELKDLRDEDGKPFLGNQDMFLELASSYIMRNEADASLTEDSDAICLRPTFPCILQPVSSLLMTWKVCVSLMTLMVTILHPYNMVFVKEPHTDFRFFNHMMTFMFFLDIVIHLSTGAKIEEGVPATFMQTATQQVSNIWFVLDLLSVLPIFTFVGDGHFAGINKLLKLPKVLRTLQELEDISLYQSKVLRFIAYCLMVVVFNWLVACSQQGYMCYVHEYCNLKTISVEPYWEKAPLNETSEAETRRLWYSVYWALFFTTTTSHTTKDLTMTQWRMQFYVMILMEISSKFRMILEAFYSATITVKEDMRFQYQSCIREVEKFLKKNDVDPLLCRRFISYLELCWYTDMYLPPDILKRLCEVAHFFYTSPNEILMNTGDICNEIFVIKQGFCEVLDPISKKVVNIITSNNFFGDVECLMRLPAYYTVRAASHVQIFSISRKHLGPAFATPKIEDAIRYVKLLPLYIKIMHHRHAPFLKYQSPEVATSRQIFPVLRKHIPDTAFQDPFHSLGFFSLTRYIFPRFTFRPDGNYLRRYEWFRALCAFLSAVIFPMYYLLVLQFPWLRYLAYFLDATAYYDVCQRLLVAYYKENGILVYHPVSTAAHYIRGPMTVDLLACLPFEYLDNLRQHMYRSEKYQWTPSTMQYLLCNRILQLYRFPVALEFLDEFIGREDIIFVIKTLPLLMVLINTMTSVLLQLSVTIYGVIDGGWLLIPTTGDVDVDHTPWIEGNGCHVGYNITGTPFNLLLTVYYWATYEITSTGYGCFQPNRYSQLGVFIVATFLGSIMITYFTVRILSIRSNVNVVLAAFQENMKDLVIFMERENIHKDVQQEALQYYEYTWSKTGGSNYRSIFKLCNQITLRTDAILHIYGQTFHKSPILYNCDLSLQRLVGRAAHCVYYPSGMTVIQRDDIIKELYILDYGVVEARDTEDDDLIAAKLPRGSMFGNLSGHSMEVCANKFVTDTNVLLLMIETDLFNKILQDFPSIIQRMKMSRQENENFIVGRVRSQSVVSPHWMDRRATTVAIIVGTRKGMLKHLHKHGKIIQIILILASIICVYLDLFNAIFQCNNLKLILLLYLTDIVCICKIAINYYMPSIAEEKSESQKALEQAKQRYYHGDFKYDLFSVLPIELFCFLYKKNPWAAFAYLRLNRFVRVTTIYNNLTSYHERLSINLTVTTIMTSLIWFTLFVHTSTCFWHLLAVIHDDLRNASSWRWNEKKEYMCKVEYICSLYFVMTTFSLNGVGDILPRQQAEVIFVIFLMIVSTMMYMIYVGQFSDIMQYQFFRCFSFYEKFMELKEFLKNNRVSDNLVKLTYKYTLHLWRTSRGLQVPLFLTEAPPCLRNKLMAGAYMSHLKKHPAFKRCERAFLRHLVGHFQPFTFHEDMYVVREGEITNSMYFVHIGSVEKLEEEEDEQYDNHSDDEDDNPEVYHAGDFFGTTQGLNREIPFTHSYKTTSKSQVLTLRLDDWEYLMQYFPQNRNTIYKYHKGLEDNEEEAPKETSRAMIKKHSLLAKKPSIASKSQLKSEISKLWQRSASIRFEEPTEMKPKVEPKVEKQVQQKQVQPTRTASRELLTIITASSVAAALADKKGSDKSEDDDKKNVQKRKSTILEIFKRVLKSDDNLPKPSGVQQRKSTILGIFTRDDNGKKDDEDEDLLKATIQKRKSTVLEIEKKADKREDSDEKEKVQPLHGIDVTNKYMESQKEAPESTIQEPDYPWPVDSRRKVSEEMIAISKKLEDVAEEPTTSSSIRKKSILASSRSSRTTLSRTTSEEARKQRTTSIAFRDAVTTFEIPENVSTPSTKPYAKVPLLFEDKTPKDVEDRSILSPSDALESLPSVQMPYKDKNKESKGIKIQDEETEETPNLSQQDQKQSVESKQKESDSTKKPDSSK